MEALVPGALASAVFVLAMSLNAYAVVRVLRALDMGGSKASFRRAFVVSLVVAPFGAAIGAATQSLAGALGIGPLLQLFLVSGLTIPVEIFAFEKGFALERVDAFMSVVVLHAAMLVVGMGVALGVLVFFRFPLFTLALGVPAALTVWMGRARRHALERRLGAVLREA
jgi:hypothetical protein